MSNRKERVISNPIKVYAKTPDVVWVTQWGISDTKYILDFIGVTGSSDENYADYSDERGLRIHFAGGSNKVDRGDYIVKRPNGSCFSCSSESLYKIYGYETIDKTIDQLNLLALTGA
jgi:hypothetical protein